MYLCNCFRNHCPHMVLRGPRKKSIFFAKAYGWLDRTSFYARMPCLISCCTYFFIHFFLGEKVTQFFYFHLMHCSCMNELEKWKLLTVSFSIQKILLRPLQLLVGKNSLGLKQVLCLEIILIQIVKFSLTIKKKNENSKIAFEFRNSI